MRDLELLAPARTADIGIAAIGCGADAVYIAGPAFGARQAAGNSVSDIGRLCVHAHRFGARIFATLNTIIYDTELEQAYRDFCEGVAKDNKTLYASENIIAATARKIMARKAMVGWVSDGHSNGYVPVFAIGTGAENFDGRIDNTDIPKKIAQIAGYGE